MNKLKEKRKEKGYSQEEIAKKLNISQSNYSKYEAGTLEMSITNAIKLANLYNMDILELFSNEKRTSVKTNPEKEELLRTVDRLTEIECHKLNVFAEGLITNRVAEQKQRTNNLINIITKED